MRRTAAVVVAFFIAVAMFAGGPKSGDSYVFRDGDITYMVGKGMSPEALKAIQQKHGDHFLWARRTGKTYVATDAKILRDARGVLQRNVKRGPETSQAMGAVVDAAVRTGAARQIAHAPLPK